MNERIIAESDRYLVLNCKGTIYSGNYQLLKKFEDKPTERTIGVYQNKKDALKEFKSINQLVSQEVA